MRSYLANSFTYIQTYKEQFRLGMIDIDDIVIKNQFYERDVTFYDVDKDEQKTGSSVNYNIFGTFDRIQKEYYEFYDTNVFPLYPAPIIPMKMILANAFDDLLVSCDKNLNLLKANVN